MVPNLIPVDFGITFTKKLDNVDIILDDGGHTNDQQIITLVESIKYINDGGLHIVEDVHPSYQKHYGNPYKYSFINCFKKNYRRYNSTTRFPTILKVWNHSLNPTHIILT